MAQHAKLFEESTGWTTIENLRQRPILTFISHATLREDYSVNHTINSKETQCSTATDVANIQVERG